MLVAWQRREIDRVLSPPVPSILPSILLLFRLPCLAGHREGWTPPSLVVVSAAHAAAAAGGGVAARVCESEYVAGVASGRTISRDRRWNIEGGRSRGGQTPRRTCRCYVNSCTLSLASGALKATSNETGTLNIDNGAERTRAEGAYESCMNKKNECNERPHRHRRTIGIIARRSSINYSPPPVD